MKIKKLTIQNYKQFAHLDLDLTYPKGHIKAGEPLDKICIIGQSGTGKSNLLDIIKKSVIDFSQQAQNSYMPFNCFVGKNTDDKYITSSFQTTDNIEVETLFTDTKSEIIFKTKRTVLENEKSYFIDTNTINSPFNYSSLNNQDISNTDKIVLKELLTHKKKIEERGMRIYGLDSFIKQIKEVDKKIFELKNKSNESVSDKVNYLKEKNFIDRSIININEDKNSWERLKERIDNYEKEKSAYTASLFNQLMSDNEYSKEASINDMKIWEDENENLLKIIADDVNSIIKRFNLELIKIDENQQSYQGLKIKDLSNGEIISYDNLSVGTKNLLATFIPLKSYTPQNSIILIDEPENSFYPNIQRELTDLYMNVGENNQLIFATHSPLIASSFEPWEVVELRFNEEKQIYRKLYYPKEEERHIDNYFLDPRMLTWTSILTDVFDLKEEGNLSFREQKLMEYGMLKSEIKVMEKGLERDEKIKVFKKLSQLLGLDN